MSNSVENSSSTDLEMNPEKYSDSLPPMGLNKPYPPLLGQRDPYLVSFDGPSDPAHPFNFPLWKKKIPYCATVGLCALSVSIGSAMFSQSIEEITEIYHVGWSVAALSTSLYVLGFAAGPIFYGPLSELFGRKFVLIPSSFGYICFSFLVGSAKDLQTILICRFFAGFIGAAPMVVSAAIMADLFDYRSRGTAIVVYAMMIFGGPMIAPIMGGFTVKNSALGWRWTSYFCGIIGAIALFMNVFVLEETRHPIILVRRAEELRRRTGNWGIAAPHEELRLNVKEIFSRSISKPLRMLITEPILLLITIYHAFVYGLLYLLLTAIPFIYSGEYHFSPGVSELPYASMLIGVFIGGGIIIILEKKYVAAVMSNNGKLLPEKRLQPMMVGCFTFVIGIFWLGWTGSYPQHIHWIVPTIGAAFVGNGLIMIFLPCFNYIIDCYLVNAASALAANTFLRASFAAAFPLFSKQMFENLTIKWATTLLGCIGVLLIPVPFVFHFYGKAIRKKSKYAFDLE